MSTTYEVHRHIAAIPQVIWDLLVDAPGYPDWNPAVISVEGEIVEGSPIALTSTVNPKRKFKLNVSEVHAPNHMVWSDGMPLGLFKGVRTFDVTGNDDDTSEFRMVEEFSGLLEPLISKSIPDQTESFEQFADGLRAAAEAH